jgi:hypothetical protein
MARKVGIVVLILLLIVLALPLGLGMAMGHCPDCSTPTGSTPFLMCIGMLVTLGLVLTFSTSQVRATEDRILGLLLTRRPERPPKFA